LFILHPAHLKQTEKNKKSFAMNSIANGIMPMAPQMAPALPNNLNKEQAQAMYLVRPYSFLQPLTFHLHLSGTR
jgi:hypothetical protein